MYDHAISLRYKDHGASWSKSFKSLNFKEFMATAQAHEAAVSSGEWLTESYIEQSTKVWPRRGRHILAQYDDHSVVVYQAFCPEIAEYAVNNQKFGGDRFSYDRMSWVKTNFMWMMYRCGWGTKHNQQRVLAVRITREGFDKILSKAVSSDADKALRTRMRGKVRLQWDPDHAPSGAPEKRRAIQLGLRAEALRCYGNEWIVEIKDITDFVREQHKHVKSNQLDKLMVAKEQVYPVTDMEIAAQIGVESS